MIKCRHQLPLLLFYEYSLETAKASVCLDKLRCDRFHHLAGKPRPMCILSLIFVIPSQSSVYCIFGPKKPYPSPIPTWKWYFIPSFYISIFASRTPFSSLSRFYHLCIKVAQFRGLIFPNRFFFIWYLEIFHLLILVAQKYSQRCMNNFHGNISMTFHYNYVLHAVDFGGGG
jgi:hypothetical protein